MQRKILLFFIAIQILGLNTQAQLLKNFALGFDIGSNISVGTLNDKWSVRQDVGTYYESNAGSNLLDNSLEMGYITLKPSFNIFDERFTIASGFRYQIMDSKTFKTNAGNNNFFYLRYNTVANRTDFARVIDISESNAYFSIPLELSYNVIQYGAFGAHIMVGADIGYQIKNELHIEYFDKQMIDNNSQVINGVNPYSNSFYSSLYASIGINYNHSDKAIYKLEFLLPSQMLSQNNSSLINFEKISGFQVSFNFLLNKKEKNDALKF